MCNSDSLHIAERISHEVAKQLSAQSLSTAQWANVWYFFQVLISLLILIIGFVQIRKLQNTTAIDNYLKLKLSLGGKEFREIYKACMRNELKIDYDNKTVSYSRLINGGYELKIDDEKATVSCIPIIKAEKEDVTISFLEFNHYFMDELEELAILNDHKGINFELIDAGYGYLILNVGHSSQIQEYIKSEKSPSFTGFIRLYTEIFNKLLQNEKSLFTEPYKFNIE